MSPTLADLETRPHFVYRAYNAEGRLLYVGCSLNVKNRMKDHKAYAGWHSEMTHLTIDGPHSFRMARSLEWDAIQTERPLNNAQSPEWHQFRRARGRHWNKVYRAALEGGEAPFDAMSQAGTACDAEFPSLEDFMDRIGVNA